MLTDRDADRKRIDLLCRPPPDRKDRRLPRGVTQRRQSRSLRVRCLAEIGCDPEATFDQLRKDFPNGTKLGASTNDKSVRPWLRQPLLTRHCIVDRAWSTVASGIVGRRLVPRSRTAKNVPAFSCFALDGAFKPQRKQSDASSRVARGT
jgi:hypothetical protein